MQRMIAGHTIQTSLISVILYLNVLYSTPCQPSFSIHFLVVLTVKSPIESNVSLFGFDI